MALASIVPAAIAAHPLAAGADAAVPLRAVDSLLAAETRAGFSGVVLIGRGGQVRYERAVGTAAGAGTDGAPPALWLASCSKQVTATAILRLQESGRLRVGDSLGRFFPRVPADKRAITVHQLLTHTSGLPSAYRADGIQERERAVDAILALRLDAAPGAKHAYSNDGYVLLAAIAEVAAGVPYDRFVHDSLFARAALSHTGLWGHEDPGTPIAPVADAKRTRSMRPTIYRDGRSVANWGYRGPTGVFATARDVHDWIEALRAEVAAGVPYDRFVHDSLFARAALSHTGLWGHEDPGTPIAPVADAKRTRSMRPTIYRDGRSVANWGYRGPTGVFATARDVHDWIEALRAGRLVGAASLRALVGRHVLVRGDSTGQSYAGYGWGVRVEDGRDVSYGHTGGEDWLGHTSVVRFTPSGDVVVVLANSGEVDGVSWATRVNRGLRRVLDGR